MGLINSPFTEKSENCCLWLLPSGSTLTFCFSPIFLLGPDARNSPLSSRLTWSQSKILIHLHVNSAGFWCSVNQGDKQSRRTIDKPPLAGACERALDSRTLFREGGRETLEMGGERERERDIYIYI